MSRARRGSTPRRSTRELLRRRARPAQARRRLLVGIWSGGAWLAERLQQDLGLAGAPGVISSALHRDDFSQRGLSAGADHTKLPFEIEGRHIVLVDDVLYTGRTIRAAVNELYDFGRPASVALAVLVDRGGRELPIAAACAPATIELPAGAAALAGARRRRPASASKSGNVRPAHVRPPQPAAQSQRRTDPSAVDRGPAGVDPARTSSTPPAPSSASTSARSRRCRCCAARASSTSSSRTPRAPARPSRSPPSGSRPTSSTSTSRARRRPRARACSTPSPTCRRCTPTCSSCAIRRAARPT